MGQFSGQGSRLGVGQFTSFFSIFALLQGVWAVFSAAKLTLYVGICSNPHTGSFGSFRAALSIYVSKLYPRFTVLCVSPSTSTSIRSSLSCCTDGNDDRRICLSSTVRIFEVSGVGFPCVHLPFFFGRRDNDDERCNSSLLCRCNWSWLNL